MSSPPRSPQKLFWQLQVSCWLVLMPFFAGVALVIFDDINLAMMIGVSRQIVGFCLTLGLWQIYRRWPSTNFQLSHRAWQIGFWCITATVADLLIAEVIRHVAALPAVSGLEVYGSLFIRFALYIAWSAFYFVIRQELESRETVLRLARAESANREAELFLLRAQMNPHFIFNALNMIISEAETNPGAVVNTTHAVADYLRYSLTQTAHQTPLGNELDAMGHYLGVEAAGLGPDRFQWKIEATAEARRSLAPTALVQPLVENAIKYGLYTSPRPLQLRVVATTTATTLSLLIENTGTWHQSATAEPAPVSTGIGLANIRRRLSLLCGPAATLEVHTPPGLVQVSVKIPFVTAPAPAAAPSPRAP